MKSIKIFAPATISNVGCGFDTIGFAIDKPGDIVELKIRDDNKILIKKITGDGGILPYEVEQNTASGGILALLKSKNLNVGLDITIRKKMPIGSGLGSSAASSVAAVYGLSKLLETKFSRAEILNAALEGEAIASGSIHADNVAPSLFGGFVLIRDYNPADVIKLDVPDDLYCAVVYPHITIKTKEARKLIKKNMTITKARKHFGNVGALVTALNKGDFELLKRSIHDEISEPARAQLIPGFYDVKNSALENGAFGCSLSGSGPSIFAFGRGEEHAAKIGKAMKKAVTKNKVKATLYISKINLLGPKILD